MIGRVAVRVDGEITVHMAGVIGDYDTFCGLDADDIDVGHEPAEVPRNGKARIDCSDCRRLWGAARLYGASEFAKPKPGEAE